jgi:methanogenic corrinoid protein MtbC1
MPEPVLCRRAQTGQGVAGLDITLGAAKARVWRVLARTLETEVIPRLVQHHREPDAVPRVLPTEAEVEALVAALGGRQRPACVASAACRAVARCGRGHRVRRTAGPGGTPAGRALWEQDQTDFATVTVGLGRLQRALRQLSPAFGSEVEHPPHGRRIVLTQPDTEQHIFGLSMVAEFFRRDGWDVLGGVAGVGIDAAAWVRRDWFDAVGFSIGSELSLPWLKSTVAEVRRVSRNPAMVVLVGGPLFTLNPGWAAEVGADATADGRSAPQLAETIVDRRVQEQSGKARAS